MKFVRTASALALSAFVLAGCEDTTGIEVADLAGFWNATQFTYTDVSDDSTGFVLNIVSPSVGGDISLNVEESGAFSGAVLIPGVTVNPQTGEDVPVQVGGTISLFDQETLSIDFDEDTEATGLLSDFEAAFTLQEDVLTFVDDDTEFDFEALENATGMENRGDVPATLSVTLER